MITRNPHRHDAGHRFSRRTGALFSNGQRGWVTAYLAVEQGIPEEDGGRWAVICQEHSSILQVDTLAHAVDVVCCGSGEFCDCCRGTCTSTYSWQDYACPICGAGPRDLEVA